MTEETEGTLARERRASEDGALPEGMDDRILAAYRREVGARRGARRSLRVLLPVAALVPVVVLAGAALRHRARPAGPGASAPSRRPEPVQTALYEAPVVTATSLAGFEPVDDMQAVVVGGSAR